MKNIFTVSLLVLMTAILASCGGDFRQKAIAPPSEVLIVVDSTTQSGAILDAIKEVYGEYLMTMPRPEPRYDLRFRDIKTQTDLTSIQKHRNIIFAAPIDEESNVGLYLRSLLSEDVQNRIRAGELHEIPLRDRWYREQWILIYTGTDEQEIANRVRNTSASHLRSLSNLELEHWDQEVYRRGDIPAIGDSLWTTHGFKFRVQHDYVMGVDTTDFVSMRRFLEDNDRWIWIWWKDGVEDTEFLTERWINTTRDSLLKVYIRGSREDAFLRTDYRLANKTTYMRLNERETYESRGVWIMSDYSMGGPYLNYVKYDEDQKRLYMMEFAQFSPRYRQRRFLYQFEAIARTFETNVDFEISNSNRAQVPSVNPLF